MQNQRIRIRLKAFDHRLTTGSNFLNQHIIEKARVHYAITDTGGVSPNVVQAQAARNTRAANRRPGQSGKQRG